MRNCSVACFSRSRLRGHAGREVEHDDDGERLRLVLEDGDVLRLAVVENRELIAIEVRDQAPLRVGDGGEHGHELRARPEGGCCAVPVRPAAGGHRTRERRRRDDAPVTRRVTNPVSRGKRIPASLATAVPPSKPAAPLDARKAVSFCGACVQPFSCVLPGIVRVSRRRPSPAVSGVVTDRPAASCPARPWLRAARSGAEQQTVTGPDGRFSLGSRPGRRDHRRPRQRLRREVAAGQRPATLEVELAAGDAVRDGDGDARRAPSSGWATCRPASASSTRSRSASRRPSSPTTCCGRCRRSACSAAPAACRRIPTAQGVSLRGIGPSGVSRTLVLIDGMPFNDPFGGWVYWTRVPLENVDRIELVDGSSSSLYGNYAMGGVINITEHAAAPPHGGVPHAVRQPRAARRPTSSPATCGASSARRSTAAPSRPTASRSSIANERGLVDNKANVNYKNFNVRARLQPDAAASTRSFRGGYFHEDRDNGKHSTFDGTEEANDTTWKYGQRRRARHAARLQRSAGAHLHRLRDVPQQLPGGCRGRHPRAIGRMTLLQEVPTTGVGGMVQWSKAFSTRLPASRPAPTSVTSTAPATSKALDAAAGTHRDAAARVGRHAAHLRRLRAGAGVAAAELSVTLSARVDNWQNNDGRNLETHGRPGCRPPTTARCPTRATRSSARAPPCSTASPIACRRWAASARASARRRSTSSIASSASAPSSRWPTTSSVPSV